MNLFPRDRRGVGAVEFALTLPVLLVLLLGGMELGRGLTASRKLVAVTRSAADLTTQYVQVAPSDMTAILNAAALTMTPFPAVTLGIVVSEITTDSKGISTVTWSQALNATRLVQGSVIQLPAGIASFGTSVMLSQTHYVYTPTFGAAFVGPINMANAVYMRPRLSATVDLTN